MDDCRALPSGVSSWVACSPGAWNPLPSILDDVNYLLTNEDLIWKYREEVKILARDRRALQRELKQKDRKLIAVSRESGWI